MAFTWGDQERPQRGGGTTTTPPATPPPVGNAPTGINPQTGFTYGSPEDNAFYGPNGAAETQNPTDPAYVKSKVYYLSTLPGANPSLKNDPDYWVKQILANGGWHDGTGADQGIDRYWQNKAMQPEGAPAGGADALGSLIAPFTEQFTNPDYVAPTGVNDQNDPGFTARMNAGQDALQRSAAAKGSLLSGSTLKALSDWNSDYASNEYAQVDSRARQTYATNSQNAYQQYAQRRANFYQNQDSPFAKLFGLAQLDSSNQNALNNTNLGYASLGASTLQNPAYASYLTGGANATAAGQVGAGNAYGGLFGNLGNTAWLSYLASHPGGR